MNPTSCSDGLYVTFGLSVLLLSIVGLVAICFGVAGLALSVWREAVDNRARQIVDEGKA